MKKYISNDNDMETYILALLVLAILLALCSGLIMIDSEDKCHKRGGVNIDGVCVKAEILKEE